jgi:hypothetical protein
MTILPRPDERVKGVRINVDVLSVDLMDGRTITVPIAWFPRLLAGTARQRSNWQLAGAGYGIHWPDLDEDISTAGLLRGDVPPPIKLTKARIKKRRTRRTKISKPRARTRSLPKAQSKRIANH